MGKWSIYHSDGTPLCDSCGKAIVVHSLEHSDEWMGDCSVVVTIENEAPIEFVIGDYLEYRGERYEINYDPGKIKCCQRNSSGDSFKYQSVKFNALLDELVRSEFLDVVLEDNQLHYTALPKFAFYVSSLDDLLDRIQANMNEQYGEGLWKFYSRNKERSIQRGCAESDWEEVYGSETTDNEIESQSLSANSNTCWEALAWVNSTFDVNFIVRGRSVYVGTAGISTANIFKYGRNNGLYEIEQNAESDQLVATRLRAYGSTKNLPSRYYAEYNKSYKAPILDIYTPISQHVIGITFDVDYLAKHFTVQAPDANGEYSNANSGYVVMVKIDGIEVVGNMGATMKTESVDGVATEVKKWYLLIRYQSGNTRPDYTTLAIFNSVKAALTKSSTVELVEGFAFASLPKTVISYNDGMLPDNMAVSTLMLPGFPKQSLQSWWDAQTDEVKKRIYGGDKAIKFSQSKYRPYVDSPNVDVIGVRPASVFFDTDDETNGIIEIYPTIEEMEVDGVRIDEINEGSEKTVTDNGVFSDGDTIPNFAIYLSPKVNFNINDLKDEDFTIHMKDGMCGGRDFKVAASTKENGRWKLTLERQLDSDIDLYFPYKDFPIKAGDRFVLTGIELPDEYVEAASEKLLKYAIAYLNENDYTRYAYTPKVDEIFMARQHDAAMADATGATKSLHDTLKAGDLMVFRDDDLGIDAKIIIDKLTIKEQEGKIPTYEITLREDKVVGTIQRVQNQINSILSGNGGSGGVAGLTATQFDSEVKYYGSRHFISKTDDDVAEGDIAFNGKITVNDIAKLQTVEVQRLADALASAVANRVLVGGQGFEMYVDDSGKSHLWVDELMVRVKAFFASLEIRKISYSGGTTLFSNAGSTIVKVVTSLAPSPAETVTVYKCYCVADDGTTATSNWWKAGDQALCQTFNVQSGVHEGVSNRYYWRLVVDAGQEEIDGKLYDYVSLAATETAYIGSAAYVGYDTSVTNDAPAAGDVIVQAGSQTDASARGNVIMLTTSSEDGTDSGAPSLRMYHGIDSFKWKGITCIISPTCVYINSDYFKFISGDDDEGQTIGEIIDDKTSALSSTVSELKMKSDEISMTVRETVVAANMLKGTAFKRQADGWSWINASYPGKIRRSTAYGGRNSLYIECTSGRLVGAEWSGLKLESGKSYVASLWLNVPSYTSSFVVRIALLSSSGGSLLSYPYTVSAKTDGWVRLSVSTTMKADYDGARMRVYVSGSSGAAYVSSVMLEQTDEVNDWSPSAEDGEYIGGNFLGNADTLTKGGNLAMVNASATVTDGELTIDNASGTSYVELMRWDGIADLVKAGGDYLLSFEAKGSGKLGLYLYDPASGTESNDTENSTSGLVGEALTGGACTEVLTAGWSKHWVHWHLNAGSALPRRVLFRLWAGATMTIRKPKLEEGATATTFTTDPETTEEGKSLYDQLLPTGVNIRKGEINLTANQLNVYNNSGEKTAEVDENGNLSVNNGVFRGFVLMSETKVTPDNIDKYVSVLVAANGYVSLDFEKLGSNPVFSGDIKTWCKTTLGSADTYPTVVLPTNVAPSTALSSLATTRAEAVRYVGCRVIIRNASTQTVCVYGGGTIKGGKSSDVPQEIASGWMAVLECKMSYTTSNGGIVYWDGFNVEYDGVSTTSEESGVSVESEEEVATP